MQMQHIPFGTTDWATMPAPGMSYQVADGAEPHRSSTSAGATLFIVD